MIKKTENKKNNLKLIDSTYREGLQGFYYRDHLLKNFKKYIDKSYKVGIYSYEFSGFLSDKKHLSEISKYKKIEVFFHFMLNDSNLEYLNKVALRNISTVVKLNNFEQNKKYLEKLNKREKTRIRLGVEDSFDISRNSLKNILKEISNFKSVMRISFSDTKGTCNPKKLENFVNFFLPIIDSSIEIEFHFHNDQGLSAANFYKLCELSEKFKDKKICVSATLGGIGERNGILSLGDYFSINYSFDFINSVDNVFKIKHYADLFKTIFSENKYYRDPLSPNSFFHVATSHLDRIKKGESCSFCLPEIFGYKNILKVKNRRPVLKNYYLK